MFYGVKNNIHTAIKWYITLNKRLLRRFEFIVMLLILPILVLGMMAVSSRKKGLLDIGIVMGKGSDNEVKRVAHTLMEGESVIDFSIYEEEELAKEEILKGKLDAIWVLPHSLESIDNGSIKIYQTDNSTIKNIAREKLYSALYPYIAYSEYIKYMNKINVYEKDILDKYFKNISIDGDFIKFEGPDSENTYDKLNYLTYPIRGFMCIWLFVGVMTANIYFLADEKKGLFSMMDKQLKRVVAPVYSVGISVNMAVVMLVTLILTKQSGGIFRELIGIVMLLTAFIILADILKQSFDLHILEVVILPSVLFLIVFAPIIFDIRMFGVAYIYRLNPIYYYLNLINDREVVFEFAVFILVIFILDIIFSKIKCKNE